MAKKIVLGKTYFLWNGIEFNPIEKEKGKLKSNFSMSRQIGERCESIFIDANGKRIGKSNLFLDKFGNLKKGHQVSHHDYSSEIFIVTNVDKEENVITTKGGKNGTWINPIEMIIRKNKDLKK